MRSLISIITGIIASLLSLLSFSQNNFYSLGGGVDWETRVMYYDSITSKLIVGGVFTKSDTIALNHVGVWDGNSWSTLGNGTNSDFGYVQTITRYNGDLYIGGVFYIPGIPGAVNVARWDGNQWYPVGGPANSVVLNLETYNGELYATGGFTEINGVQCRYIAKWDGSQWHAVPNPLQNWGYTMEVYNGELYVGGNFDSLDYVSIAKYDGNQWYTVGGGIHGDTWVSSLKVYKGELYIGGEFKSNIAIPSSHLIRWNGSVWKPVGEGLNGQARDMVIHNDKLYMAGQFNKIGDLQINNTIAIWDGTFFCSIGDNIYPDVGNLAIYNNSLVAGGSIISINGDSTFNDIVATELPLLLDTCIAYYTNTNDLFSQKDGLVIYPNPAKDIIYIKGFDERNNFKWEISNSLGQIVLNNSNTNRDPINISSLPSGLYILQVSGDNVEKVMTAKFIKE